MTIQQLEYVVAVDKYRHFVNAAEACNVTQPTLSMMIQKLEEELDAKIFDRSAFPIKPTPIGKHLIEQACVALRHFNLVREIVEQEQNVAKGSFQLGIIPTIAPYIVPELLHRQTNDSGNVELVIKENPTAILIEELLSGAIDGALMAGPLHHPRLIEYPLYYEKFYAYVSPNDKAFKKRSVDIDKVDLHNLWLLENVHCFRGQIERLCQMKQKLSAANQSVKYEAGSIDTLIHIVDCNNGMTVIPEMSAMGLSEEKQENLRTFKNLTAVREVSLVVSEEYIRKTILHTIMDMIRNVVPKSMQNKDLKKFVVEL